MIMNTKYEIALTDTFREQDYPDIIKELALFRQYTVDLPCVDKATMLISFLRDHSIRSDLVYAHPDLVGCITSRQTVVIHMESLFESCSANNFFRSDFEQYIRHQLE
jgi:hypothetical protein